MNIRSHAGQPLKFSHYEAVLFDLDGTLLDSYDELIQAAYQLFSQHGLQVTLSEQEKVRIASFGARQILASKFGDNVSTERMNEIGNNFFDLYAEHCHESPLFTGVEALLRRLDRLGIPWGIATNKPRQFTQKIAQHFQWSVPALSPQDVDNPKPLPDMLLKGAELLQCSPTKLLMVGDTITDQDAAANASVDFACVTWSTGHSSVDTTRPYYYADSPADLLALVKHESLSE